MKAIHLHGSEYHHAKLMSMGFTHYLGCQDTWPWLVKVKGEQPNAHIIIRFADDNRMDKSGKERAWEDFNWFLDHEEVRRICEGVIPDNELNLDDEHSNNPWWFNPNDGIVHWDCEPAAESILHWKLEYIGEFRRLCGGISWFPKIHFGAYSPSAHHAYQYQAWAVTAYDVIDYHHYGTEPFKRILGACSIPYMITEFNQGDYIEMLNRAEKDCQAIFWFLWSTQDRNFEKYQMCEWGESELQRVREWKQKEVQMPEFRFGIKDEANRLRGAGINPGEPLGEEYWFLHDLAVQPTTTGQFWVHKVAGAFHIQFYPKASLPLA